MQNFLKTRIFRTFSANDWNISESNLFFSYLLILNPKQRQVFPQMRKICGKSTCLVSASID